MEEDIKTEVTPENETEQLPEATPETVIDESVKELGDSEEEE